jgi:hypothetical protein
MAPNEALRKWIASEHISHAEAARRAGYDRSNFHRLLAGRVKPNIDLAHAIQEMTHGEVPMAAWAGFEPAREAA